MKKLIFTHALLFLSLLAAAQGLDSKNNHAYQHYYDSLKAMDYPYTFPLPGKKAYKKGYNLPYAWGAGLIFNHW